MPPTSDREQGRVVSSDLHEARLAAVLDALETRGVRMVADLGCGPGALVERMVAEPWIERVTAVELRLADLDALRARLDPAAMAKTRIIHGSFTDPTLDLGALDAAVMLETIEHIDPDKLSLVERSVFRAWRPRCVVVTTPNAEFNPVLGVPPNRMRHWDHRFEWGRERFADWAAGVAGRHGYRATTQDVGEGSDRFGSATQMAVFDRLD